MLSAAAAAASHLFGGDIEKLLINPKVTGQGEIQGERKTQG
jgi:hypothetical protein